MQNLIKFGNNEINIIDINGEPWLRGRQIGAALKMARERDVQKIYKRHRNEFTEDMTASIEIMTNGGKQLTRIFSLRGAKLIAMLSNSPVAAQFRAEVLDKLENKELSSAAAAASQIARQQEIIRNLQKSLLASKPKYKKILRYYGMGLNNKEIGLLIKRSDRTVRDHLKRMRECGLIEPKTDNSLIRYNPQGSFLPAFDNHREV